MNLKSVITKAKLLEDLYLRDSGYNDVKLVKGGAKLRTLVIRETYIPILCFGDWVNLEVVQVKRTDVWVAIDTIFSKPS
jgi:hypothetical protein